jgi:hypothetical protein
MKKPKQKDETKPIIQINRSRASGKKRQDLFAKFRNTEHPLDDMFPVATSLATEANASTAIGINTLTSTPTSLHSNSPIAPVNNFQKVTNTITKEAIPQRLFRTGKTKEIYDVLYSLTRGAIVPRRSVVISKPSLRKLTGVGSRITIDTCLGYLEIVNLVRITKNLTGQHEGNEYEVFTPEEVGTGTSTPTSTGGRPALTVGVVPRVVTRRGRPGSEPINIGALDMPKTSSKTSTNIDDEAFQPMLAILRNGCERISGKAPQKSESAKWKEFAELIVMELEVAAARTNSISSVPAFLTEHLRRRLSSKPDAPKSEIGKSLPAGKKFVEIEAFIPEPLTNESREVVLKTFKDYVEKGQRDFVLSFEETYTKEDWLFLMDNLE